MNKIAKTMRIFEGIEHKKVDGLYFFKSKYNPSAFSVFYSLKYSHGFSYFIHSLIQKTLVQTVATLSIASHYQIRMW